MTPTDRKKSFVSRHLTLLFSIIAACAAVSLAVITWVSYTRDSRNLKDIRSQYEDVRTEYKIIAARNDPSDKNKKEMGPGELKRKMAGTSEDIEAEIRGDKLFTEQMIEEKLNQIEEFLSAADD